MIKNIWYQLIHFTMFKFIIDNIKGVGFWKWLSREFNTGYYAYGHWYWGWKGFTKSMFNYLIGHPFLGFGISSIWVIAFGMSEKSAYLPVLTLVILEEMRQTIIVKRAARWWPVDSFFDVLTWLAGAGIFNILYNGNI